MLLTAAAIMGLIVNPACGNVPPGSDLALHLQATWQTESGGDPFIIGVNADLARGLPAAKVRSATAAEAATKANVLLAQGRSIDLGLFQINDRQLSRHHLTTLTAFDECANTAAATQHLSDDFQAVWDMAHRRYNCGSVECGASYARTVMARVGVGDQAPAQPQPPSKPPCAPAWDAWAVAACSKSQAN